uniref:Proteasome assembly chaperone 2 n=1 Tax=Spermophilus dauricus TaxID=99837 RepID=A0A8C9QCL0_SPEDA
AEICWGDNIPDALVIFGFTLLMPAVSVGNVGKFAIDLIISTLNMRKIGYFYTDCLVPIVGNNPYATEEDNSTELSTNAEGMSLACSIMLPKARFLSPMPIQ